MNDIRAQIEKAISYPLRQSEIADFRYENLIDNLETLIAGLTAKAVFSEFLPNDGEYEYTGAFNCDGTAIAYFRRTPALAAEAGSWEKVDEETYLASQKLWGDGWADVSETGDTNA